MVLVIEGRLRLELADDERRTEAGDFHAFASDQPYTYVNDGDKVVHSTRNVVSQALASSQPSKGDRNGHTHTPLPDVPGSPD